MPIRCLENRVFSVTANRCGQEARLDPPLRFTGRTCTGSAEPIFTGAQEAGTFRKAPTRAMTESTEVDREKSGRSYSMPSVSFTAMTDAGYGDHAVFVVDFIQDSPLAYSHAPSWRMVVSELETPRWAWIFCQCVYCLGEARQHVAGETAKVPSCTGGDDQAHQGSLPSARSSAFSSFHGIESPPSFLDLSRCRMSSSCSAASMRASYSSIGKTTAVRWPFSSVRYCLDFFAVPIFTPIVILRSFYDARDDASRISGSLSSRISIFNRPSPPRSCYGTGRYTFDRLFDMLVLVDMWSGGMLIVLAVGARRMEF